MTKHNHIIIRPITLDDSENLIKCVKSYLANNTIPLTLHEYEELSVNHVDWIKQFTEKQNNLCLVAELEGRIVGNIDLICNTREMLSHTAYLGMGVHAEFQGLGIGTKLLHEALRFADQNKTIEIVWLQVFASNLTAFKMYEKVGFKLNGQQKQFFKLTDGSYVDNLIMSKQV